MDVVEARQRVLDRRPLTQDGAPGGVAHRRAELLEQRLLRMQRDGPAAGRGRASRVAGAGATGGGGKVHAAQARAQRRRVLGGARHATLLEIGIAIARAYMPDAGLKDWVVMTWDMVKPAHAEAKS